MTRKVSTQPKLAGIMFAVAGILFLFAGILQIITQGGRWSFVEIIVSVIF